LRDPLLGRRLASAAHDKLLAEHTWIRNAEAIVASVGLR
jgi:hypothetical protein